MRIYFIQYYKSDKIKEIIVPPELRKFCTACKHMQFMVGNPKMTKDYDNNKVYCSFYAPSQVPITSSRFCRYFKLQYKYIKL